MIWCYRCGHAIRHHEDVGSYCPSGCWSEEEDRRHVLRESRMHEAGACDSGDAVRGLVVPNPLETGHQQTTETEDDVPTILESRKQETVCVACGHAFWAWGSHRKTCYLCEPNPVADKAKIEQIKAGTLSL